MLSNSNNMLPFFYHEQYPFTSNSSLSLDESNSKHVAQVLRMQEGDALHLTNGRGQKALATITLIHKKNTQVHLSEITEQAPPQFEQWLAISFTKNRTRTEWLIEKATELGIDGIIPLECVRSERLNWNHERLEKIMIAAMLQSQQVWLPQLTGITKLKTLIEQPPVENTANLRWGLAHCLPDEKTSLLSFIQKDASHIICIGPEGDFTEEEINMVKNHGMQTISLGNTRLRTETAGVYAVTLLNAKTNEFT